jgi:transposase
MTSVMIDREIGDWKRFGNRRQIGSYTGLCPGEYSSGNTRLQSCVTKHGNPRLRAALVELAWRLVRFQPDYKPVRKWRVGEGSLSYWSRAQESHRSGGAPTGRRSLEDPHRPAQP